MPIKYVQKNSSPAAQYTGSHAGIGVDSDDNKLYFNANGTVKQVAEAGGSMSGDLTATNSVSASDNGKTFFLNHATEFVTTLPAPAAGLKFRFVVKLAPSGANYTVVTASSANLFIGSLSSADLDAGSDASSDDDGDTISFVGTTCVAGDWAEVESDGTSWYVSGHSKTVGGITITKAS